MEFEILDGIIRVLDQTLNIDILLINEVRSLKILLCLTLFCLLLLTLYSIFSICYNSKRIRKIEKKLMFKLEIKEQEKGG